MKTVQRSAKDIRFIRVLSRDEPEYTYLDSATERSFQVRAVSRLDRGAAVTKYFLEEMIPSGRMTDGKRFWDEPRVKDIEAKEGANALMRELRALGLNPDHLICGGAGLRVDSIYLDSLGASAEAIARALREDVRYTSSRELTDEERRFFKRRDAEERRQYYQMGMERACEADASEAGIFKGCHSMIGPLSAETKRAILDYLNAPSQAKWEDVRGHCVVGLTTLWQAWCAVDAGAPKSGADRRHPAPEMLRHAIRAAVAENAENLKSQLDESQNDEDDGVGRPGLRLV